MTLYIHCNKNYEIPGFFLDQTLQGLAMGKLFLARGSLVCDILAGDGKSLNLYLQCTFYFL